MRVAYLLLLTLRPAIGQDYTLKALSRHALTNESIVSLAQAGFDESFIVERIQTSRTSFSLNVEDLVALKKAGISEDLIRAMLSPTPSAPLAQAVAPVSLPTRLAPEENEPVENKWWKYPWVRVRSLICR